MLTLIDRLAGWWLDMRLDRATRVDPELTRLDIKKAAFEDDGLTVEGVSPVIALFAEEAARMLDKAKAENYLQFDMMPRLDRGMKWIRVTVAWAGGKSPAQRVIETEKENALLKARIAELTPTPLANA